VAPVWTQLLAEIRGHSPRSDEISPRSGGAAGNARLTAWTGLTLLALVLAELLTLLDTRGLLDWHVAIGAALIPYALLKTASTTWRMVGYYARRRPYHRAGPPPTALRVLGPFVIASTLAVLASGVTLVLRGEAGSREVLLTAFGQRVDWITLHQICFAGFDVTAGLHLICRLVPALLLAGGHRRDRGAAPAVPGRALRVGVWVLAAAAAVVTAVLLVQADGNWGSGPERSGPPPGAASSVRGG
jgi:hypothetical protein